MGCEACDKDFSTYTLEHNYILSTRELKYYFLLELNIIAIFVTAGLMVKYCNSGLKIVLCYDWLMVYLYIMLIVNDVNLVQDITIIIHLLLQESKLTP